MAVPFLTQGLGPAARLAVEVAWGADITADPATWTWTDITEDVRQEPGIELSHGRSDEAGTTQPATCGLQLDNSAGAYSLGGQSPNWPNVRQNTPVRVRVDHDGNGVYTTLFQGYAAAWRPGWDQSARVATVELSAAGVLRRLGQNTDTVLSAMRRGVLSLPDLVAYWPAEEAEGADRIASGLSGEPAMSVSGAVEYAATDVFAASRPIPRLNSSRWFGTVPGYTVTGESQVRFLIDVPDAGGTDDALLISIRTRGGSTEKWDLVYGVGGSVGVRAYSGGVEVLDQPVGFALNGRHGQFGLSLTETAGDVDWVMSFYEVGASIGSVFGATLAGHTVGQVHQIAVNGDEAHPDLSIGHLFLEAAVTSQFTLLDQVNAYNGEKTTTSDGRLARIDDENSILIDTIGSGEPVSTAGQDQMGPQEPAALVTLLRDCETADQGILYDGLNAGLRYRTRRFIENQDPVMTVAADELGAPLAPTYDDQGLVNRALATRRGGGTGVHEDTDGPLGIETVGVYDTSVTVNAFSDLAMQHYAGWLVNLGTVDGYRYPTLTLDLAATPHLAGPWRTIQPGSRIDVTGITDVVGQHPAATVSLLVQGYTQTITPYRWDVEVNCSPYQAWRIAVIAEETGDVGEFVWRLDTDGSELADDYPAGATSIQVSLTNADGAPWTTNTDDYPLLLEVGGVKVRATAASGVLPGSRTFTVDPLPTDLASGVPVALWQPPVLGL